MNLNISYSKRKKKEEEEDFKRIVFVILQLIFPIDKGRLCLVQVGQQFVLQFIWVRSDLVVLEATTDTIHAMRHLLFGELRQYSGYFCSFAIIFK